VKFTEIASRLTDFSIPLFGVQWTPPVPDVTVARKVVVFLEDRRVLYNEFEVEMGDRCVESVIEIRRFLTDTLGAGDIKDELADSLRAMRAACRKFMDRMGATGDEPLWVPGKAFGPYGNGMQDLRLNQALGELRGVFGVHVAQVAVRYGIDVEDGLASIIPAADA
jgi:hypothetical protein